MTNYKPYMSEYINAYIIRIIRASNQESWYAKRIDQIFVAKKNYIYEWNNESQKYDMQQEVFNALYGYVEVSDVEIVKQYYTAIPIEQWN